MVGPQQRQGYGGSAMTGTAGPHQWYAVDPLSNGRLPAVLLCLAMTVVVPLVTAEPLTLRAARDQATGHSGQLSIKYLDLKRTSAAEQEARARGLPRITFTGSATFMTNPPAGIAIKQGAFGNSPTIGSEFPVSIPEQDYVLVKDPENTYFKLSLALEQVLWTGGKINAAISIAGIERQLADNDLRGMTVGLSRDVAAAYFGAVLARDSLRLLDEAVALFTEIVADKQTGFDGRTGTLQDLLEAKANAARISAQRAKAAEGLHTGLAALEFYTGRRPDADDLVDRPRQVLPTLDETRIRTTAKSSSSELAALRLRTEQARLAEAIDQASLPFRPDISLNVSLDITGQEIPLVKGNWTDTWDYNILFTIGGKLALFDAGAANARLQQATARREAAEAGQAEMDRGLDLMIRRLIETARSAAANIAEKQAALDLAVEQRRVAGIAFRNQLITRGEERGARVAAIAAELELVLAQWKLESALLEIEHAMAAALPAN